MGAPTISIFAECGGWRGRQLGWLCLDIDGSRYLDVSLLCSACYFEVGP